MTTCTASLSRLQYKKPTIHCISPVFCLQYTQQGTTPDIPPSPLSCLQYTEQDKTPCISPLFCLQYTERDTDLLHCLSLPLMSSVHWTRQDPLYLPSLLSSVHWTWHWPPALPLSPSHVFGALNKTRPMCCPSLLSSVHSTSRINVVFSKPSKTLPPSLPLWSTEACHDHPSLHWSYLVSPNKGKEPGTLITSNWTRVGFSLSTGNADPLFEAWTYI